MDVRLLKMEKSMFIKKWRNANKTQYKSLVFMKTSELEGWSTNLFMQVVWPEEPQKCVVFKISWIFEEKIRFATALTLGPSLNKGAPSNSQDTFFKKEDFAPREKLSDKVLTPNFS